MLLNHFAHIVDLCWVFVL